ncbi:MAG TPA: hypothetical protein VGJ51_13295 [Candidatus Angelobacter sp.]
MKTAVYQINEAGAAYLVCVRMPNLSAAYTLEFWLKMHAEPGRKVTLLGGFDHVHAAIGQDEAEALILGDARHPPTGAVFTIEELVDRVLSALSIEAAHLT